MGGERHAVGKRERNCRDFCKARGGTGPASLLWLVPLACPGVAMTQSRARFPSSPRLALTEFGIAVIGSRRKTAPGPRRVYVPFWSTVLRGTKDGVRRVRPGQASPG